MDKRTAVDAFNMLVGDLIGKGSYRDVFACKLRPEFVVKVENDYDVRSFQNAAEMRFWDDHAEYAAVAKWLAPCEFLSPDGRILLQVRCKPIDESDTLPDKLPKFLTDRKRGNFGWYKGRVVCFDYGFTITNPEVRLTKAEWW